VSTVAAPLDPWGRSVVNAVRRWAYIPILLAALGAVTGGLVGMAARPSAEALVSVRSAAVDGAGLERAAETAALAMGTMPPFTKAAGAVAVDPGDLRSRTKIGVKPNTQTISVTVTATTSEQAVREATAVAVAAVQLGSAGIPDELKRVTEEIRKLIREQTVTSTEAERARLASLGEELATRQSAVLANGQQLTLLQEAEPARLVPATPVLVAMGGLVGMLLGLGVAQLLGVRRGTVQSGRELSQLYPEASVIQTADLRGMLALEPRVKTVIVAGVRRNVEDMVRVTERIRQSLILDGRDVVVRDASPSPDELANGYINLVPTMLNETVLRRSTRDDGTLLLVPVQPRVTRLEALDVFAPRLNDRSYLLVDERVPEWN
jgi:capsular polysaccharide biosynthesis protein